MTDQEQFFYDHAGWSHDPKRETSEQGRERCARELAAAEELLLSSEDLFIIWSVDEDESTEEQTVYLCLLCRDTDGQPDLVRGYYPSDGLFERPGVIVASLGGIELEEHPNPPYKRVVQAELMQELEAQRESMAVRGEN